MKGDPGLYCNGIHVSHGKGLPSKTKTDHDGRLPTS